MTSTDQTNIEELLRSAQTIAVLGASDRTDRPAYYVPRYLVSKGYRVFAVNPRHAGQDLWEGQVAGTLAELEVPIDIVNVFRRSEDIPAHVDDILALDPAPRAVWFQLGIRNDEAASRLRQAGIEVIQNRCILVDRRALD